MTTHANALAALADSPLQRMLRFNEKIATLGRPASLVAFEGLERVFEGQRRYRALTTPIDVRIVSAVDYDRLLKPALSDVLAAFDVARISTSLSRLFPLLPESQWTSFNLQLEKVLSSRNVVAKGLAELPALEYPELELTAQVVEEASDADAYAALQKVVEMLFAEVVRVGDEVEGLRSELRSSQRHGVLLTLLLFLVERFLNSST